MSHLQHDVPPLVLDTEVTPLVELVFEAQHPLAARQKVARVLKHEEAEQVGVEQRAEQLVAHGHRPGRGVGWGGGNRHESEFSICRGVSLRRCQIGERFEELESGIRHRREASGWVRALRG
eukprot:scaffold16030_cov118-Isochrysis_galbana.AAC.2